MVVRVFDATPVKVAFDVLVVATGCAYGSPVRPTEGCRGERLLELESWSTALARAQSVLIVGGGAVGVELAAEIASRTKPATVTLATASGWHL